MRHDFREEEAAVTRATLQRFLAAEGLALQVEDLWVDPSQRPSALCYIQTPDAILLLKRENEPFKGFWTAPGGKMNPGETPLETVKREIWEETSLELEAPQLRFIASELGPRPYYCWLLFGFVAYGFRGQVGRTQEGLLEWIPRENLHEAAIPEVDRALLPYVLEPPAGQVYLAHIRYGLQGELQDLQVDRVSRT